MLIERLRGRRADSYPEMLLHHPHLLREQGHEVGNLTVKSILEAAPNSYRGEPEVKERGGQSFSKNLWHCFATLRSKQSRLSRPV